MPDSDEDWAPGSFTKNFSWGPLSGGLVRLHESIRHGFDNKMEDVRRDIFRRRVKDLGRPDFIPINFFLFNKRRQDSDYLAADELVFQALNFDHSSRFDKLALFTFYFSYVGRFSGSSAAQRRPALWAFNYVKDRVAGQLSWDTRTVNADDIQAYLKGDPRYKAQTSRKLATNLAYMFDAGKLSEFGVSRIERWWVDCLFLALDRLVDDRSVDKKSAPDSMLPGFLADSGFPEISGTKSIEKSLATNHLIHLYTACGGRRRFSDHYVEQLTRRVLEHFARPNSDDPQGAIHPTNARVLKSIPRICAMLAKDAGYDIIDTDELLNFNLEEFVREHTRKALQ